DATVGSQLQAWCPFTRAPAPRLVAAVLRTLVLTAPVRHTTVVTPPVDADRISATVAQLDVLELVQSGALPAYPLDAPRGSVELCFHGIGSSVPEVIDVTDLEGVPFARIAVRRSGDELTTRGPATELGAR